MTCKLSRINIIKNFHKGDWGIIVGTASSSVDICDSFIQENTCNYLFFTTGNDSCINIHSSNSLNNIMKSGEKNSANVNIENPIRISSIKFNK